MKAFIFGCGKIAGGYNEPGDKVAYCHALALRMAGFELSGCFDQDKKAQKDFEQKWTIEPSNCSFVESLVTMSQLDLLCYCGPVSSLKDFLTQVLESSNFPKVLLLEKPIGLSISDVDIVSELVESIGSKILINYFRAYDPFYIELQNFVIRERSQLESIHGFYYRSFTTNCSHWLERLFAMLGSCDVDCMKGHSSLQEIDWNGVHVVLNRTAKDSDFALMELDLHFRNERLRVVDSEQRIEHFRTMPDPNFPGFRNLVRIPLSESFGSGPSHSSFGKVFQYAAELVRGDVTQWDHLSRSRMIAAFIDRMEKYE